MIVFEVVAQDSARVTLAEHDHVVQALAPERAHHALAVPVLPRRLRRDDDLLAADVADRLPDSLAVDLVAVADDESRCGVEGERLRQLHGRPLGGRVRRHVHVHDAPAVER